MGLVFKQHKSRIAEIRKLAPNLKLVEMWECDWNEKCKSDINLKNYLKENPLSEPLNRRDALYGGRTESLILHYKCKEGEKIHYIDYTSLYPSVQKTERYPKGHPIRLTENFDYSKQYYGIIKAKVLPPRKLIHPVLPSKINGKNVNTLCRSCAENLDQECNHTSEERALTGTWVTSEFYYAIELGYQILEILAVDHWEESEQYDPRIPDSGLFTKYINSAIKEKQEASGYPDGVETEEQKDEYIQDFFDHEGIFIEIKLILKPKILLFFKFKRN
jgi:hypothetical protein